MLTLSFLDFLCPAGLSNTKPNKIGALTPFTKLPLEQSRFE